MLFRPSEHQTASLCDVRRQIIFSTKWAEVSWAVPLGRRNWKEFKLIESVKFILIRTISTFNSVIWSPYIDLEMKKKRRICLVTMSAKTNLAKILESDIWCSYQYNIMTIIWTNIIQHYIISVIYSILSCFTWTRSWTSRCTPRWPPWLSCPPPPSSPSPSSAWSLRFGPGVLFQKLGGWPWRRYFVIIESEDVSCRYHWPSRGGKRQQKSGKPR